VCKASSACVQRVQGKQRVCAACARQAARVCSVCKASSACVQRVQGKQRVCAACTRQAARVCSVCKASSACVQRVQGKQRVCAACARQAARVCSACVQRVQGKQRVCAACARQAARLGLGSKASVKSEWESKEREWRWVTRIDIPFVFSVPFGSPPVPFEVSGGDLVPHGEPLGMG
jgi:hypothetical protein